MSRTFGDCEAKLDHLGVVACDPQINYIKDATNKIDYILIGSDGIFDRLKNEKINEIIW